MRITKLDTKLFHIIEVSEILIDRLQWIRLKPEYLLCSLSSSASIEIEKELKKIYPDSIFFHEQMNVEKKVNLVFGIISYFSDDFFKNFPASVAQWKKNLSAGGLLMLGILDASVSLPEAGDFLMQMGFEDIVIDKEILLDGVEMICVSAWIPRPVNVPVSALRRHLG